jgi:hypothetical protein
MRMLMKVGIPNEPFNTLQREGRAGQIIGRILEATTPEAVYFGTENGQRGGVVIVNIENASDLPSVAEPWFLSFNATVEAQVCMTPDDLGAAGLDALGAQWGR